MKNNILYLLIVSLLLTFNIHSQTNWLVNTLDVGGTSSALGDGNIVNGYFSLAAGESNNIDGNYSSAFGQNNSNNGNYSLVVGRNNYISNNFSIAAGMSNNVTGMQSGAFGVNNQVSGLNSFAIGHSNKTNSPFSFALGHTNEANGTISFAIGNNVINNKNYSFLVGFDANKAGLMVTKDSDNAALVGIGTDDPQSRLDIRLADRQQIIIQSEIPNTYGGIRFNHNDGSKNWNIRAFSNFGGGYGNILGITSHNNQGDFWVEANKILFGNYFDFDDCTDCTEYKLFVKKGIRTEKVKVDIAAGVWADYVFDTKYDLKSINEVEKFIDKNGHLPNMPSAIEIEENGLDLGKMNAKLLEKIEELTLYVIELKHEVDNLKNNLN